MSPALDAVVMRALEKDPARRFQDADAFIAALDAAQRDPGDAGGGTTELRAAAVAGRRPPPTTESEGAARQERRRNRRWILLAIAVLLGVLAGLALDP